VNAERSAVGNRGEEAYRTEYEQWADMRDSAREATGGVLVESTTDTPEQVIAANMMQPVAERGQVVTVSHAVRPRASDGATDHENFTTERYIEECDGRELRQDKARFDRNCKEFRKTTPDFDVVTTNGGDVPIYESVRRTIVGLDNGPQVEHFLAAHPEVADSLLALKPLAAAAAVRAMARDLANQMVVPEGSSYEEYKDHTNARRARLRRGR
jgi:hypothetical protein